MGKLIWWIAVIVLALVEGVRPIILDETPLIVNGYYTSTLGIDDPAAIYASYYNIGIEDHRPCNVTPRSLSDIEKEQYTLFYTHDDQSHYFVLPIKKESEDYSPTATKGSGETSTYLFMDANDIPTLQGETLYPIVAPFTCRIQTDPAASNHSTEMVVTSTGSDHRLSLKITGMTMWYCCITHDVSANGKYQHYGVTSDSYSDAIKKGQVLGYANENTKFCFFKDGKPISFDKYYYLHNEENKQFTEVSYDAYTNPDLTT